MLGNLWRFDINGDIGAAGYDAQLLVTFLDANGGCQPVTAKPVVTTIDGKPVVYIGTGSYLGVSDISSTQSQTMYAVKDKFDVTTYSNPRASGSGFVAQTLVAATCGDEGTCTPGDSIRKITSPADLNWTTDNGWYVDFLTPGNGRTPIPRSHWELWLSRPIRRTMRVSSRVVTPEHILPPPGSTRSTTRAADPCIRPMEWLRAAWAT